MIEIEALGHVGVHGCVSTLSEAHGAAMRPALQAALAAAAGEASTVVCGAIAAEVTFAAVRELETGQARTAAAIACVQLADFCTEGRFHTIGQTDRGLKIAGACRRILRLGDQAEAEDPEPLEFVDQA